MKWSFIRHARVALVGRALIREALQAAPSDLPDLYWLPEIGWVVTWD